jgi:hypothetical protein
VTRAKTRSQSTTGGLTPIPGDSGAPVWDGGSTALGIVSGTYGGADGGSYTPIGSELSTFGVFVNGT